MDISCQRNGHKKRSVPSGRVPRLPRALGQCLAVGLEFELAADILRTAVTPTWNDIEQLIAIAALRTGLNYFLAREIRQESQLEQRRAEAVALGPRSE